jgi:hypothetical protein
MTTEEGFKALIVAMNEHNKLLHAQNRRIEMLERNSRRSQCPYRRGRHDSDMPSGNTPQRHDDAGGHLLHDADGNPMDTVIVPANDNPESS